MYCPYCHCGIRYCFPGVVIPITVGRDKSLRLVQEVYKKNKILGAVAQKDGTIDDPELDDLYRVGTVAQILKILEMPDGSTSVIIQGRKRFMLNDLLTEKPYHVARITPLEDDEDEPAGEAKGSCSSSERAVHQNYQALFQYPHGSNFCGKEY